MGPTQGSSISVPSGHILSSLYFSRILMPSGECGVSLADSTSPVLIFPQW